MAKKRRCPPERAKTVKKELIDRNMSQKELANLVGISQKYLIEVLSGRRAGTKYWAEIERVLDIKQHGN